MEWNLVNRCRSIIHVMERDQEMFDNIRATPGTFVGVKENFALMGLPGWRHLFWMTWNAKGLYIFLEMVKTDDHWEIKGDEKKFKLTNGEIWDLYIGNMEKWATSVTGEVPSAGELNSTTTNLGPWPKPPPGAGA